MCVCVLLMGCWAVLLCFVLLHGATTLLPHPCFKLLCVLPQLSPQMIECRIPFCSRIQLKSSVNQRDKKDLKISPDIPSNFQTASQNN